MLLLRKFLAIIIGSLYAYSITNLGRKFQLLFMRLTFRNMMNLPSTQHMCLCINVMFGLSASYSRYSIKLLFNEITCYFVDARDLWTDTHCMIIVWLCMFLGNILYAFLGVDAWDRKRCFISLACIFGSTEKDNVEKGLKFSVVGHVLVCETSNL